MSSRQLKLLPILIVLTFLPGCEVIIGIFEVGFWSAIILVALVIGLGVYGYKKFKGRR